MYCTHTLVFTRCRNISPYIDYYFVIPGSYLGTFYRYSTVHVGLHVRVQYYVVKYLVGFICENIYPCTVRVRVRVDNFYLHMIDMIKL